jgi:hypothetical protein
MLAAMRRASSRVRRGARLTPNRFMSSLDHLVGELLELRWHIKAECRGGLEVDDQIELLRPLYRQVTRLGTVQDFGDVIPASSEHLGYVRPISYQTAELRKFTEQANEGDPFGQRKLADLLRSAMSQTMTLLMPTLARLAAKNP